MRPARIKQRILDYLAARPKETAFLRSEFVALAESRSGVDKALRALIKEDVFVRGGWGVLVRAVPSDYSKRTIPLKPVDKFATEVLKKLGVQAGPSQMERDYRIGRTNQMQANLVISVNRRISRKIGFGRRMVRYEKAG